jgi:hypothetical protein
MRRLMETEMASMSPDERAELEPSMRAIVENMVRRSDETVEFRGDGVALINGHDGKQKAGRWERQGDRVRLEPEGETLRLRAEGEPPSRSCSSGGNQQQAHFLYMLYKLLDQHAWQNHNEMPRDQPPQPTTPPVVAGCLPQSHVQFHPSNDAAGQCRQSWDGPTAIR